jgi:23S rRNA (guanosine2251-2'-O)-methyltransferase
MILFGINSVREALRAGRVRRMRVGPRADDRIRELLDLAAQAGIPVERVDAVILDRESRGAIHQGVVAQIDERREASLADLASTDHGAPLIVVLDGIEDPHNVGAILRTVDAVGAGGLVRQERRAAPLDAAAAKTSAGAVAWVTVVDVVNIARALEELKTRGVWTVGLDADAGQSYDTVDFTLPTAVVLGAEGTGLRRLVRERCDVLASIPMAGHVGSLNVSVAAGVVLFEAARQRRGRQPR